MMEDERRHRMAVQGDDISHLAWPEFADRISRSVVVIPVGSVEQHGPHLPLGVDAFIPYHLGLRLAARLPVLVTPPIWYAGPSDPVSGGGQRFPGTLALRGTTLIELITRPEDRHCQLVGARAGRGAAEAVSGRVPRLGGRAREFDRDIVDAGAPA